MKFLLYTTTHGRSGSIQLGRPAVYLPILGVLFSLFLGGGYLGYRMALPDARPAADRGARQWESELEEQRREIAALRQQARDHLDALAVRLGQLQSSMLRVEALGQRLVRVARLKKGEFNFDQLPAQGGPADPLESGQMSTPDFLQALDELEQQIENRALQLEMLERLVMDRELKGEVSPAGRPITKGWISSYFGKRTDPFTGRREMHKGMDFAGRMSSDIVATASGVVTWAGKRYGYGKLVEVNHGNGYSTRYGHCEKILVKVGDKVEPGQKLALMGSTGRSTGPHVHYEVLKNGRQINPGRFVQARR